MDQHPHYYHSSTPGTPEGRYERAYPEEDEIDLVELAAHFWGDRWLIAKITSVVLAIGLCVALFSSVEYETDAVLLPELQNSQGGAQGLINKYGGLLGISGGGAQMGSNSVLPPQLYPRIVESVPYQAELMQTPLTFSDYDTMVTTQTFFEEVYSPSILSYVKGYTIGLPGKIIELLSGAEEEGLEARPLAITNRDSVYDLTEEQWETVETLRERVTINSEEETGVVTLTATMPDAQAAADLGRAGIRILKLYVQQYRTQNAKEDLAFIEGQVATARSEFEEAQQELATFRDQNIDLTSARSQTQEQELQSAYDLSFNTYNSLRQQAVQARLDVQQQTPVFSVLQPVTVPLEKSSPQRGLIMVVSLFLGIILGLGWSLVRGWGATFMDEVRKIKSEEGDVGQVRDGKEIKN